MSVLEQHLNELIGAQHNIPPEMVTHEFIIRMRQRCYAEPGFLSRTPYDPPEVQTYWLRRMQELAQEIISQSTTS